jgi:beta-glucanase (GH16 family)
VAIVDARGPDAPADTGTGEAAVAFDCGSSAPTNQGVNANPVYLMLNTAVGGAGSWPGAPDQTTVFPNYMDIDYVRVYQ